MMKRRKEFRAAGSRFRLLALALLIAPAATVAAQDVEPWNTQWEKRSEMSEEKLRKTLTPEQYAVTQEDGTERPFKNAYWDNHRDGIYVDVVSGEPLFSSKDKYESGTGWPSFTQPLVTDNLVEKQDRKLWAARTEVRSKNADSHLGHVFEDGPEPTGMRYCMNSASLRFVPIEDLESEGYGEFLADFGLETSSEE